MAQSKPWRRQTRDAGGRDYSSRQLRLFEAVLHDALDDLRTSGNPLAAQNLEERTRQQMAAAIFRAAAAGERDYLWLKTRALQSLS